MLFATDDDGATDAKTVWNTVGRNKLRETLWLVPGREGGGGELGAGLRSLLLEVPPQVGRP